MGSETQERGYWGEPVLAPEITPTGAVAGHCVDIDGYSWHRDGQVCAHCGFGHRYTAREHDRIEDGGNSAR